MSKYELDRPSGIPKKTSKYTKQYCIREIQRFQSAFPKQNLSGTLYENWSEKDGNRHSLVKPFGSWGNLLIASGVSNSFIPKQSASDEYCIEFFQKVWDWNLSRGKGQPSAMDLKHFKQEHPDVTPVSVEVYQRRWGGLPKFAKLFVKLHKKEITQAKLINSKTVNKARRSISPRIRALILKRDDYTCQDCGKSQHDGAKLEVHHKIPVSKGGTDDEENLVTNCKDCNIGKGDKIIN